MYSDEFAISWDRFSSLHRLFLRRYTEVFAFEAKGKGFQIVITRISNNKVQTIHHIHHPLSLEQKLKRTRIEFNIK